MAAWPPFPRPVSSLRIISAESLDEGIGINLCSSLGVANVGHAALMTSDSATATVDALLDATNYWTGGDE